MSVFDKKTNPLQILQYIVFVSLILYFGRVLFIPLAFGLLLSFVLFPLSNWMINKKLPVFLAYGLPVMITLLFFLILFYILISQILEVSIIWEQNREKILIGIDKISFYVAENFDYSAESQKEFLKNILNQSGSESISFIRSVVSSFSGGVLTVIMIPIFATLILVYHKLLTKSLYSLFPENKRETIRQVLVSTVKTYFDFVKSMALVYLIVGILNSIGLAIVGIPHPLLFGFIASILTFIPYVGILIASLLPISVAMITFDSVWYSIYIIIVFVIVQVLEAYLLFPYIVGNRLKINTLAIFVAIALGGILWGAAGMILFIPMLSIMKIIADKSEGNKSLSILLGEEKD